MGLKECAVTWFQGYLSNRTQQTRVEGALSESRLVKCGVPQGSILGPLLFLVYINDMPQALGNSVVSMYADDTAICMHGSNYTDVNRLLQSELDAAGTWLRREKMSCFLMPPNQR